MSVPLRVSPRRGGLHGFLGVHPVSLAAFGMLAAVPAFAPWYWTRHVTQGLVLAISCLGLLVLVGWAREISLLRPGSRARRSTSPYGPSDPRTQGYGAGWTFPMAAALGIAFVVAVSFVTALVAARLAGAYVIVLTLSVQFWLENFMLHEKFSGGLTSWTTIRPTFFGRSLADDEHFYYVVLGWLAVVMVVLHRARNSRFGRSMILAGADPVAAAAAGVSPWRYRVWAFVVAGALAGLAGALSGASDIPSGTLDYLWLSSVFYLAVPVLAGFDSIVGTAAVAVVLTVLPGFILSWRVNLYLLGGIAMLVGVFLGPRGLGGFVSDRLRT